QQSEQLGSQQIWSDLGHPKSVRHRQFELPDVERVQPDAHHPGSGLHERGRDGESLPQESRSVDLRADGQGTKPTERGTRPWPGSSRPGAGSPPRGNFLVQTLCRDLAKACKPSTYPLQGVPARFVGAPLRVLQTPRVVPFPLECILSDSSKRSKGLHPVCRWRDPAKAGVLSETAGARLRPWLNSLHRRVETDLGTSYGCARDRFEPRISGACKRSRRQDIEAPSSPPYNGFDGRSQPAVPRQKAARQTGKSLQWIERLRKSSSRRSTVSSRAPPSWSWLRILASPLPRCRPCAGR